MHEDADYKAAFAEAEKRAVMALEDEAVRRAREGVRRPVRYKGKIVGYETDYSDQLLVFLLKNWAPDKYREQLGVKFEWDGDPAKLNPQQQERLMTYLASIAYPDDPAAAEIEKRKALGLPEGQVIDATLAGESTASEVHGASGESRRSWGRYRGPGGTQEAGCAVAFEWAGDAAEDEPGGAGGVG